MELGGLIVGLLALYIGGQGWIIMPLERIFRYLSLVEPRFKPTSQLFSSIRVREDDPSANGGYSLEGAAGCLGFLTLPFGLFLLFGEAAPAGLALLGFNAYLIFSYVAEARADKIIEARKTTKDFGNKIQTPCPACTAPLRSAPGANRQVTCPVCRKPFKALTAPRLAPGWALSGLVVGVWMIGVQPWRADGASPPAVLGWSLACLLLAYSIPPVIAVGARWQEKRPIDFKVLSDVRLILIVAAAGALFLTLVQWRLMALASADAQGVVVRQVLAIQAILGKISAAIEKSQIGLWISFIGFFIAAALLRQADDKAAKVLKIRKSAAKGLKIAGLICLVMTSFSLVGVATSTQIDRSLLATRFALHKDSEVAVEKLRDLVARGLIHEAADQALAEAPPDPDCGRDAPAVTDCPADLRNALNTQLDQAEMLRRSWPAGETPDHASAVRRTQRALDVFTAVERPTDERSRPLEPAIEELSLASIRNAQDAVEATAQPPSDGSTLKDLVGLGVDVLADLLPWKFEAPLNEDVSPVAKKLTGVVTDAVRAPFDDLVRDTLVKIAKGCNVAAACADHTREMLKEAAGHPIARALGARVAAAVRPAQADLARLYQTLRTENRAMDLRRQAVAERALASQSNGPWGRFRGDMVDGLKNGLLNGSELGPVRAMAEAWRQKAFALALAAGAAGRSEPPGGWDQSFLTFLNDKPSYALAFSQLVSADQEVARSLGVEVSAVDHLSRPGSQPKNVLFALSKAAYGDHEPPGNREAILRTVSQWPVRDGGSIHPVLTTLPGQHFERPTGAVERPPPPRPAFHR